MVRLYHQQSLDPPPQLVETTHILARYEKGVGLIKLHTVLCPLVYSQQFMVWRVPTREIGVPPLDEGLELPPGFTGTESGKSQWFRPTHMYKLDWKNKLPLIVIHAYALEV